MMGGFGSGFGGFGGFGLIGMLLNLVLAVGMIIGVVLLALWYWRRINPADQATAAPRDQASQEPSPKELLLLRYVRGEITREQYQQILADVG